jgi:signal transduction histidine kinase
MPARSPKTAADLSQGELDLQREALRRGLRRASVASMIILLVVVTLTLGIVWKAGQSSREAEKARAATARAEAELWNAKLNEARARRIAGGPGARTESETLVRQLVRRPDLNEQQLLALREEAIAQLSLVDVVPSTNWVSSDGLHWDSALTRYVRHSSSNCVEVRDYPARCLLASFRHPSNAIPRRSVFTPDGRLLATRFSGSDVLVWEIESGDLVLKTRCEGAMGRALMTTPDSSGMLMYTAKGLLLQRFETNSLPRPLQPGRAVVNAAFTRDGRRLAVVLNREESTVEVWDVATGATLQRFDAGFPVWTFEWHPDGRRLVLSGNSGRLGIWDTWPARFSSTATTNSPHELLRLPGHAGAVVYTMFSPDGAFLNTHSYDQVSSVWDVISGRRLLAETRVSLSRFNDLGDRVLAGLRHAPAESVCTFKPPVGFRTLASAGEPRPLNGIHLSPDGRMLVVMCAPTQARPLGESCLWDFQRGTELARFPGSWAEFSRDGQRLFACERRVLRCYELGSDPLRLDPQQISSRVVYQADPGDYVNEVALSTDGRTAIIATFGHVIFLDLHGAVPIRKLKARAHGAFLNPDASLLALRLHNFPARLVNPTNGAVLAEIPSVVEFVFSPDGKWIAGKGADKVRLLERASLKTVREIPLHIGSSMAPAIAFAPDSSALAVAHNRFDVQLLDLRAGRELATFSARQPAQINGHRGLAFTEDGRHLVAAKEDGEVVAWNLPVVRQELATVGLDWGAPAPPGQTLGPIVTARPPRQFSVWLACAAAAFAGFAGLFVFLHQRQSIASYARVEFLAVEQQTKLQTAQDQLLQSQKMRALGTLAAGIAHDFNNLLSVIRLSNQLAAEQTQAAGTARENMEAIDSAVAQGETIVQSMLGYSRAAAEVEKEYSVAAAISETVAMLGKKFLSGVILKLEVQPDLPPVCGVRGRLEQMLLNLVVNASEAMNGQGTLRLAAFAVPKPADCTLPPRDSDGYVEVQISDSGPGIPAAILPRVFEPFFTTKTTGARPGTGLGLATVYTMAQQDGLGLGVQSVEGRGTTFRILIPLNRNAKRPCATVGGTNPV